MTGCIGITKRTHNRTSQSHRTATRHYAIKRCTRCYSLLSFLCLFVPLRLYLSVTLSSCLFVNVKIVLSCITISVIVACIRLLTVIQSAGCCCASEGFDDREGESGNTTAATHTSRHGALCRNFSFVLVYSIFSSSFVLLYFG